MTNFFVAGPKFSLNVLRVRLVSNFSRASNFIHFRKSYVDGLLLWSYLVGFKYLRGFIRAENLTYNFIESARTEIGKYSLWCIHLRKSHTNRFLFRSYLVGYMKKAGLAQPHLFVSKSEAGFTLIEMLVVMGILTMLGSLALFVNLDTYYGFMFRGERDTLISTLQKARSQSMNNICLGGVCVDGKSHGVHITKGEYVIFQGGSYSSRDTAVDEIIFSQNNAIELSSTSLEVVFAQLSGDTAVAQEIGLSDGVGHHSTTSINTEGRISWTN